VSPACRWLGLPGVGIRSFVREGVAAVTGHPRYEEVPAHRPSLRAVAEAALDRSFSRGMNILTELPHPQVLRRARAEAAEMAAFMADGGFHEDPVRYHRVPAPPDAERRSPARVYLGRSPTRYQTLAFSSGYEPHPGEPGGARWLLHPANHTVHAQLFEHAGGPRPWVVGVHGFGMGTPLVNFTVFQPERLHRELGWNVVMPSLPLHGRRGVGRFSGREVLAPDYLRIVHLLSQAVWDVRRVIAWIRARGGTEIALYGISLGAYVSALVCALEDDVAGVIAGIPAVDFPRLARDHEPRELRGYGADAQIDWEHVRAATHAVSPLAFPTRVPQGRRFIFAGTADRVSRPDQARALWRHWDRCEIHWFAGGHVAAQWNPTIAPFVDASLLSILGGGRP
jgi:dienelactone hydrolase